MSNDTWHYGYFHSLDMHLFLVINNTNVPVYKCFHVSWYTKQPLVIMSAYMDEVEPCLQVEGIYG